MQSEQKSATREAITARICAVSLCRSWRRFIAETTPRNFPGFREVSFHRRNFARKGQAVGGYSSRFSCCPPRPPPIILPTAVHRLLEPPRCSKPAGTFDAARDCMKGIPLFVRVGLDTCNSNELLHWELAANGVPQSAGSPGRRQRSEPHSMRRGRAPPIH